MNSGSPFFIVGAGRSGTTLLRLMLNGHSRLYIPSETWFITPLVRCLPLDRRLRRAQVEEAVAIITGHERWPDMAFPAEEFAAQALALRDPLLGEVVQLVYARQRRISGKPRIGSKTPHYFAILPELAVLFPDARFIHVIRDGRDVAISWIDAGWNRYHEPGFEWLAAMRQRLTYRTGALRGRIHEVRYEALVGDPVATLHGICGFLGEAFEPGMLHWRQRVDQVPARDRPLHRKLDRALSADAIGVWRDRLAGWECLAIEACLHRHLRLAGYQPRYAAPGWRPLLLLLGMVLRRLSPLLSYLVPRLQRRGLLPRRFYV